MVESFCGPAQLQGSQRNLRGDTVEACWQDPGANQGPTNYHLPLRRRQKVHPLSPSASIPTMSEAEKEALSFSPEEIQELLNSILSLPPHRDLPLKERPCADCAVECKFYSCYSAALSTVSTEEQLKHSRQWFCHSDPGYACRGNANFLGIAEKLTRENQ